MIKKGIIKKIFVITAWSLVIIGITTLLVAANRRKQMDVCKQIMVGITGTGDQYYIREADILALIEKTSKGSPVMKPVSEINLQQLEKALRRNPWIRNAELYFDSGDVLHVQITERTPIARVFTNSGSSFYMDSSGHHMPLLESGSIRLPVVTGFTNAAKMNAADSAQLDGVKKLAWYIFSSDFWNAQIGQVIIREDNQFELVPVVGDHIIRIGNADNIEQKLNRLFVFYKQVLAKTGFNKYAALDIRYDRQVVAIQKGPVSAVDSIQLQKNIEALMNRSSLQKVDDEMLPEPASQTETTRNAADSNYARQNNSDPTKTNPDPVDHLSNPPKTTANPLKTEMREPKAVMKKKKEQ